MEHKSSKSGACGEEAKAKQERGAPFLHDWLPIFLSTPYFAKCAYHPLVEKSGCNIFCLQCRGPALCKECVATEHSGHSVLNVRKVSRKCAIVSEELQAAAPGLLLRDVVLNYKANGYDHCYLSPRFQDHKHNVEVVPQTGRHDFCAGPCNVLLQAPDCAFCSLNCKLVKMGLFSFGVPGPAAEPRPVRKQVKPKAEGGARSGLPPRPPKKTSPPKVVVKKEEEDPECVVKGPAGSTRRGKAAAAAGKDKGKMDAYEEAQVQEEEEEEEEDPDQSLENQLNLGLLCAVAAADEEDRLFPKFDKKPRGWKKGDDGGGGNRKAEEDMDPEEATGDGSGSGSDEDGGSDDPEAKRAKVDVDTRGFTYPVVPGVENKEIECDEERRTNVLGWLAVQLLADMLREKRRKAAQVIPDSDSDPDPD